MDGGAWWATVHGVVKSRTQLHFHFYFHHLSKDTIDLEWVGEESNVKCKNSC